MMVASLPKLTQPELERAVGRPLNRWAHQCHQVSLAIVKSGLLPASARVARGFCRGVHGQHSWVVVGDPYDPASPLLDATLWCYDPSQPVPWIGTGADGLHTPHGLGRLGRIKHELPHLPGPRVELEADWSPAARRFLGDVGPLSILGWGKLLSGPVQGWPAAEIVAAAHADPRTRALIPIDYVGMLTDINPGGAYF